MTLFNPTSKIASRPGFALSLYLLYEGVISALIWMGFAVNSLYRVNIAHLDPLELVLVGTTLELSIFLFEIPTGVVADLKSRRLSVIIGVFMIGASVVLEGLFPIFAVILLGQFIWGVGYTFTSGALQAWISDEIGEERAAPAFLKGAKYSQVGAFIGVAIGTALGTLGLYLPFLVSGGLLCLVGFILTLVMPETGFKPIPQEKRSTFHSILYTLQTAHNIARHRPALQGIFLYGFIIGLYSEGFDRLWIAYMVERFQFPWFEPVVWFGVIEGVSMLLSAVALGAVERKADLSTPRAMVRIQVLLIGTLLASLAAFAISPWFFATVPLYWLITILREVDYPIYTAWVNHKINPEVRATVLSASSLVDSIGQIAGGPIVGLVARSSLRAGLLFSAALLTPALGVLAAMKKDEPAGIHKVC